MNTRMQALTQVGPTPFLTPVPREILQRKCACGTHTVAGGECEECKKRQLQRSADGRSADGALPASVHETTSSGGQVLPTETRAVMEHHFGRDFSGVRVHAGEQAARSARAVNALAYTVGSHVVFGAGKYDPQSAQGHHLLAHELAHVTQQNGRTPDIQPYGIASNDHPAEREAEAAADAVTHRRQPHVGQATGQSAGKILLHRHKDDLVAYAGGQSASVYVIKAGKVIYMGSAVSGHPGHGENEPSAGPIPDGRYVIHPGITRPPVTKSQVGGVCGANSIASGYQEITSTDPTPCTMAHYCNVPCPTTADPAQKCFTPRDCWGPKRIKIEGSKAVVTPSGERKVRDGFYLHGGNPADTVSSGCVKSLNDDAFTHIRTLTGIKGATAFCVGTACEPDLGRAISVTISEAVNAAMEAAASTAEKLGF
jgi:uncharacterized protein DUF4157